MSVHFPPRELLIIETCFPSQLAKDAILKQVLSVSVIKKKRKKKKKHLGGWQPYHRLVFRENKKIYLGINEPTRLILTSEAILMSDHIVRNKRK